MKIRGKRRLENTLGVLFAYSVLDRSHSAVDKYTIDDARS